MTERAVDKIFPAAKDEGGEGGKVPRAFRGIQEVCDATRDVAAEFWEVFFQRQAAVSSQGLQQPLHGCHVEESPEIRPGARIAEVMVEAE